MNEKKYEEAVRFISDLLPHISEGESKSELLHSLGTGLRLINLGYNGDVVVAAFLHEIFEETEITEQEIESKFGKNVLGIVKANTKNFDLKGEEKVRDIIKRCAEFGEEALVVKAADIYENYKHFERLGDKKEMKYDEMQTKFLFENTDSSEAVFEKLKEII